MGGRRALATAFSQLPASACLRRSRPRVLAVERSVYTTLNLFEATEHTLQCACWSARASNDGTLERCEVGRRVEMR